MAASTPPDNPLQNVTFPSNGRTAHGYLAPPESGTGPGVVVIQEWWGLTSHIADVTNRLAAEGFVALAPDLYCLLYTSPSPRDLSTVRMPSSA